jgi:hypothetical protein
MASFCVFFFYRPTGRLGTLHCRWHVIATQPIGLVPFQARGILQRPEEQSRTGSCQGSSVAGQPQCPRLWHRSTPNARSLSHSPSAPPPSFTQSPYPPRSLVRDEQTHPHRPRLVVSHSTCPPLSSSPHANRFVIGPAVIKHTHYCSNGYSIFVGDKEPRDLEQNAVCMRDKPNFPKVGGSKTSTLLCEAGTCTMTS